MEYLEEKAGGVCKSFMGGIVKLFGVTAEHPGDFRARAVKRLEDAFAYSIQRQERIVPSHRSIAIASGAVDQPETVPNWYLDDDARDADAPDEVDFHRCVLIDLRRLRGHVRKMMWTLDVFAAR